MFGWLFKKKKYPEYPISYHKFIDPNKLNVYLAGPINKGESNWRVKFVSNDKVNYVNPENWNVENCGNIVDNDIEAIKKCDLIFCYCQFLTAGTSMELVYAHKYNKPVILVIPRKLVSPWHSYHVEGKPYSSIVNNFNIGKKLVNKFIGENYED